MGSTVLETRNLTKRFGGFTVVDEICCQIENEKITSIIGPNGAGKTTLFNLIGGFLRPDSGDVVIDGKIVTGFVPYRIARLGICRTFQLVRIFPQLSVLDNILLGYQGLKGDRLFYALLRARAARIEFREYKKQARNILSYIGLAEYETSLASDLSYGQQKLLEIGRALASNPRVIMLDEPMAGLSMTMIEKMVELIRSIRAAGKAVVIIEHNMEVVLGISDTVMVMDVGKEIAFGNPDEVSKMPAVVDAYLGIRGYP